MQYEDRKMKEADCLVFLIRKAREAGRTFVPSCFSKNPAWVNYLAGFTTCQEDMHLLQDYALDMVEMEEKFNVC